MKTAERMEFLTVSTETARRVMNVDGKELDIKKGKCASACTMLRTRVVAGLIRLIVGRAGGDSPRWFFDHHGVISLYGSAMPVMALYGLNIKSDSGRPRAKASSTPSIGSSAFFFFCLSVA